MPAGKRNDLEPVTDEKIIQRYFRYTAEFSESVSCLVENLNLRFDAIVQSFEPSTNTLSLDITDDSFKAMSNHELIVVGREYTPIRLSFTIGDVLYFAGGKSTKRFNRSLSMQIEFPIYKLQRRNALRMKPLENLAVKINIEGVFFDVYDISASGISIIIPKDLDALFPKGKVLKSILGFTNTEFNVGLEVMSMSRLKKDDDKKWKIGFKFKSLPTAAEQAIAREAYLHTHKIWARWI